MATAMMTAMTATVTGTVAAMATMTDPADTSIPQAGRRRVPVGLGIVLVLGFQALCTVFFVSDILSSILGIRTQPISWQTREMIEIGAALGLIVGLVLGGLLLLRANRATQDAQARLGRAQTAFGVMLQDRFTLWGLSPAERDVALFAIKGFSTAEIAGLRGTSEGTIKAQSNAIYRKAGVSGRAQLLGVLIEDLVGD